jgi:NhaP-type Na+/H+ or K+/H+ antiporter
VVFLLNVLAFLLMGMQARGIVSRLSRGDLGHELAFAGIVCALVVLVRLAWVMVYTALVRRLSPPSALVPDARLGLVGSWCGMRGIVTLATAFALPASFPGRDRIVLSAFAVVLGTLVVQGLTLGRLIAFLRIEPDDSLEAEVSMARTAMLDGALRTLADRDGEQAAAVRAEYESARAHPQQNLRVATPQRLQSGWGRTAHTRTSGKTRVAASGTWQNSTLPPVPSVQRASRWRALWRIGPTLLDQSDFPFRPRLSDGSWRQQSTRLSVGSQ